MTQLLIMFAVFMGVMLIVSSFARRQQQRMLDEQARRAEEALVPGTWVRTTAGFYGRVVEADGDVVTLATPLGDETLWAKRAIVGAEEPPFAPVADEDTEDDEDGQDDWERSTVSGDPVVPQNGREHSGDEQVARDRGARDAQATTDQDHAEEDGEDGTASTATAQGGRENADVTEKP